MRRRTQRVLISLFAFLIAGVAMTNAYTFEVLNWSPFGVLNLEKLILKPDTTHTGIIIDGSEYKIKIDPYHEIADGGQIRVYQICDENGDNCKNISDLGAGGSGSNITIDTTGNQYQYCYTTDGQHLYCDQTVGNATITLKNSSGNIIDSFNVNATGDKEITIQGGNNGGGITVTGTNGFLCTKSGINLVCNSTGLDLSDFLSGEDGHLCRRSGNKLICNGRFGNGKLSINNSGNQITIVRTDGLSGSNIPLDGTGLYNVYLPHIPVVSGTNYSICLKSGDDTKCYGTMNNGKLCKYDSSSKTVNCTENLPGNRKINFKNSSGAILYTFSLNDSGNDLDIIWPSGAGGGGQPGPQGATGENGISVVDAFIEGNNIVFELSNNSTIILEDALINLKGDQGVKGDTGAVGPEGPAGTGISSVTTGKIGKITTVTFNYTNGAPSTSFQISDGADGNGGSGIDVEGTPNHRCSYQCEGGTLTVNWTCGVNLGCFAIQREVQDKCGTSDTITDTECIKEIIKIGEKNPGRLDYNYNGDDCSINCNEPAPTIPDTVYDSIITIKQGSNTQQFSLNQSTDQEILLDLGSGGGGGGAGLDVEGVPGKRCKYACTAIISGEQYDLGAALYSRVGSEGAISEEIQAELDEILSQLAEGKMPDNVSCNLDCNYTPSSTTTNNVTIAGDYGYLCTKVSDTKIECLTDPADFSGGGNTYIYQGTAGLWTGIKLNAITNAITPTNNMRYLYLTGNSVIRHKGTLSFEVQGLNAATSPVKFDAMGARFGAHAENAYGLGTIGGVSIAGRLLVGQYFDDNYIYIYSSGSHSDDNRHYEIRASKELAIGTDSGAYIYFKNYDTENYKPFRIGVNTRDPAATFDVNGSIRINTNELNPCVPSTCNGTTEGSIIFRSHQFYGCMYKNGGYGRYRFQMADSPTELSRTINCSQVQQVSEPQQGATY